MVNLSKVKESKQVEFSSVRDPDFDAKSEAEWQLAMSAIATLCLREALGDTPANIEINSLAAESAAGDSKKLQYGIKDFQEIYGCSYGQAQRIMRALPKSMKFKVGRNVYILREDYERYVRRHASIRAKGSRNEYR